MINRTSVSTGTSWEALAGYSRAVRIGPHIWISGTTATDSDGKVVGAGDPGAQTRYILLKIELALSQLGGRLTDVVRTRVYIRHIHDWEPVAKAHGEVFAETRPANTLVEARLVGDEYLVEIEAEAYIQAAGGGPPDEIQPQA